MNQKSQNSRLRDSLNPSLKSNSRVKRMGDAVVPRNSTGTAFRQEPIRTAD
ncbi:MAG: hypothetical protein QME85_07055 [Candidatus Saccharicenans sp.]|nr:hypothetical protein [Candidatus Saccharicenans sp.]MDI6848770.1 hypothetical protein [Candidatus Saccharicenans sp.]